MYRVHCLGSGHRGSGLRVCLGSGLRVKLGSGCLSLVWLGWASGQMSLLRWALVLGSLVCLILGVVVVMLPACITGVVGLVRSTLSDLPTWGDKGIFAARDLLEYRVTKVLHEHLFLALHVSNSDILQELVGVIC